MGTFYSDHTGNLKSFVQSMLSTNSSAVDFAVVGSVAYILFEFEDPHKAGCRVRTIEVWKLTKRDGEVGYKPISEYMGPYYWDCPKRLLDRCTPTTCPTANQWRTKCAVIRQAKARVRRLKVGQRIEYNGVEFVVEHYHYRGKLRVAYRRLSNGMLMRISRLHIDGFLLIG